MSISKRNNFGRNVRAHIALFVFLFACFSVRAFAQVPVGSLLSVGSPISDLGSPESAGVQNLKLQYLKLSDDADLSDYETTDFTFELSDLVPMPPDGGDDGHHKHKIKCQKITDLDFGRAFSGANTGTVVMDPNTNIARKQTGSVILDNRNMGHPASLKLTIYNTEHCDNDDHCQNDDNEGDRSEDDDNNTNDSRSGYSRHGVWNTISLPNSTTLSLTLGGNTYTMTADTYTFIRTNGNFHIGATLHVGANQVAGVYTGTFTVTQTCD